MNSVRPWFVFVAVVASLVAGQLRYAVVLDGASLSGSDEVAWDPGLRNAPRGFVEGEVVGGRHPAAATRGVDCRLLPNLSLASGPLQPAALVAEPEHPATAGLMATASADAGWLSFPAQDLRFDADRVNSTASLSQPFR